MALNTSLALTALAMGLAGGPHCLAMCGAVCAGLGAAGGTAPGRTARALWGFQLGRLLGYAGLGALAAASVRGLGWLGTHTAALRPAWTMLHVAALLLGLVLVVRARQPLWLDASARAVWQRVRGPGARGALPFVVGLAWALLPCGLLYSALLVAALAGGPLAGAGVMALFALGSGLSLMAGPWLWLRLAAWRGRAPAPDAGMAVAGPVRSSHGWPRPASAAADGRWGVRIAGVALAASAGWALLHGTAGGRAFAAWCLS